MDIHIAQGLQKKAQEQTKIARDYAQSRLKAAQARVDLLILLTAELSDIRAKKKNAGIEMAMTMLCETNAAAKDLRRIEIIETAKYKGFEKIIESLQNEISYTQSMMKYQQKGEQYGA